MIDEVPEEATRPLLLAGEMLRWAGWASGWEGVSGCEKVLGWDRTAGWERASGSEWLTGCERGSGWEKASGCVWLSLSGCEGLSGCEIASDCERRSGSKADCSVGSTEALQRCVSVACKLGGGGEARQGVRALLGLC